MQRRGGTRIDGGQGGGGREGMNWRGGAGSAAPSLAEAQAAPRTQGSHGAARAAAPGLLIAAGAHQK